MVIELKSVAKRFRSEIDLYRMVLKDPRTPWYAKFFLGAAVVYTLSPIDIVPDFIPVIGHLDDLIVVPILVLIGLRLIPPEIITEHRQQLHRARDMG